MRRMGWWIGILVLLCLVCTSCGPANREGTAKNGSGHVRYERATDRNEAHRFNRDDGYMGITNANPNLRVGDWYTPTVTGDMHRMARMAKQVRGVRDATVEVLGGNAHVSIVPEPGLTAAEKTAVKQEVYRRLTVAMPRYHVHVRWRSGWFEWLNPFRQ